MDLKTHTRRPVAAVTNASVKCWRRVTWPVRIAILLSVTFAIIWWIPSSGWALVVVFFMWITAVLVWLLNVLRRWRHLSWASRLVTIGGIVFTMIIAISALLGVLGQKPIAPKTTSLLAWVVIYIFFLAGLAAFERELTKVTGAAAARVLLPFAMAFLYLFPPILVFLATNGNVNTFKSAIPLHGQQTTWADLLEQVLLALVPLLLIVIPEIMRRKLSDINVPRPTKDMVPKELAAFAALATGLYILMLHFNRGPLGHTHVNQLFFAIVAVVLLLGPLYGSLARTCWEQGVATVFSPAQWLIRPLATMNEICRALILPANQKTTDNSGGTSILGQTDGQHMKEGKKMSRDQPSVRTKPEASAPTGIEQNKRQESGDTQVRQQSTQSQAESPGPRT